MPVTTGQNEGHDHKSRALDPDLLAAHIRDVRDETRRSFPNRSLPRYQTNLISLVEEIRVLAAKLSGRSPLDFLLPGLIIFVALLVATVILIIFRFRVEMPESILEIMEPLEASTNLAVLVAGTTYFVWRTVAERRRHKALSLLHKVRSQIHILDMTQLAKNLNETEVEKLSLAERIRYLDYCSQTVSLTAKAGALIITNFEDPVVISAVTEIETLSTGLSQKIWSKINVLHSEQQLQRTIQSN